MKGQLMSHPSSPRRLFVVVVYGGTIFLSSFLLFLVQPLIAKLILPWFGGSAAVWTTCLLFFQVALLLGYFYAHVLARRLGPRSQALIHVVLLAGALFLLPVIPGTFWKSAGDHPALRILALLSAVVGLPYVLLSATSPLLQSWYVLKWPGFTPYRFFALSNIAAVVALASYPIWIEPQIPTRAQAIIWSGAFGTFAVLCGLSAWLSVGRAMPVKAREGESTAKSPTVTERATWIALAAGGSMLLLSTTNQITQNVAAVPLLWIVPLVIYLLTFILCFESSRWYRRGVFLRLLAIGLASIGYSIYDIAVSDAIVVALPIFMMGLFFGCMYCHGELSLLKPEGRYLTTFYLMIALGGALGALVVGLAAPAIFAGIYELPLTLVFIAVLALRLNWGSGALQRLLWVCVTAAMTVVLITEVRSYHQHALVMMRSFYGALRVVETNEEGMDERALFHGTIKHGLEFLAPDRRMAATTYYGPPSGAGLALRFGVEGPKRVGVIGLGAGTLSAYGQSGDSFHFYEINPQVIALASSEFFFLRDTMAQVEVTTGDARLSLESEPPQGFDVLVVDAFSGDAIPVHLITREAFALYLRHLKPEGILAFHVSNQYLDLVPVAGQLASSFGYPAVEIHSASDEQQALSSATWVLITRNRGFLARAEIANAAQPIAPRPGLHLWTDDYNDLLQVMRWVSR
jgi:hypothetical protein